MRPPNSLRRWIRQNLFSGPWSTGITLILVAMALYLLPGLLQWALTDAILKADAEACQALEHGGACWGVVTEKYRVILFGRYPYAEQWRPLLATSLLLVLIVGTSLRLKRTVVLISWALMVPIFFVLMGGGRLGLSPVGTDQWGGFPLTLLLTTGGMVLALPLAIAVALGRHQTRLPLLRALCAMYVEVVRGVPLISVLFLASFLFPIILPQGFSIDVLVRVQAGIVLFAAAYLAETVRGGLQSVSREQHEAAAALGLRHWQAIRWIILPQAIRAVIPSIMNSAVSIFKDTSLVTVVSLYELTGALSLALSGDAQWRSFYLEAYLFIGSIYWIGCYAMSRFSLGMEGRLGIGEKSALT